MNRVPGAIVTRNLMDVNALAAGDWLKCWQGNGPKTYVCAPDDRHIRLCRAPRGGKPCSCRGWAYAATSMPWFRSPVNISNAARCLVSNVSLVPVVLSLRWSVQVAILLLRQCLLPPGGL